MNTLFVRTFLAFTGAMVILVAIVSAILFLGFDRSLHAWSRDKEARYLGVAQRILNGNVQDPGPVVLGDTPFFVYDVDRELVYSNRGIGLRRATTGVSDLMTVRDGRGAVIGYASAGGIHFQDDSANLSFLQSIYRVIWIALASSMGISLIFATVFSKRLSDPARRVSRGIDAITSGAFTAIPEKGADEISSIARSANRLGEQLAREREMRNQWIHDVTHDLRTPVSALRAQFEGMRDGVLEATRERIDRNIAEIARVEHLVNDLEELMRLEVPEMRVSRTKVDPRQFLEEVRDRYQFAAEAKGAEILVTGSAASFRVDVPLLSRAVINCAANAVRHVDSGGRITLESRDSDEGTVLRICNTGDEIPAEERERVFDRLYRGESARQSAGSGLGLTIARRITELHGGKIEARPLESTADRGTEIRITIPHS